MPEGRRLDHPLAGQVQLGVLDPGQPKRRVQVDRPDLYQDRGAKGLSRGFSTSPTPEPGNGEGIWAASEGDGVQSHAASHAMASQETILRGTSTSGNEAMPRRINCRSGWDGPPIYIVNQTCRN